MALIDLHKELVRATSISPISSSQSVRRSAEPLLYTPDEHTEKELTSNVLKLLVDPIGEVKNMAVSWSVSHHHPVMRSEPRADPQSRRHGQASAARLPPHHH